MRKVTYNHPLCLLLDEQQRRVVEQLAEQDECTLDLCREALVRRRHQVAWVEGAGLRAGHNQPPLWVASERKLLKDSVYTIGL